MPRPDPANSPAVPTPGDAASDASHLTFGEVFARFGAYVPALLRRLGVAPADVPDLSQDVFTVVHEKLGSFRGDSTAKTWICGIALRVASNHRRRPWVQRVVFFANLDRQAASEPYAQLELRERVEQLERVLAQLPAAQRDVFVLFEVEELAMCDVARALGCPEKTAYTRLYAARRFVTRQLARADSTARKAP
jgi:RNA polymerase sigma-70 factor (ECF subfamily)